jgi:hypothetical protein
VNRQLELGFANQQAGKPEPSLAFRVGHGVVGSKRSFNALRKPRLNVGDLVDTFPRPLRRSSCDAMTKMMRTALRVVIRSGSSKLGPDRREPRLL